jgi:hypothetical protein
MAESQAPKVENQAPKIARLATDTISTATNTAASNASAFADAGSAQVRTAVERGMEQATRAAEGSFKAAQEFADFSRGNAEIFTKVAQTWMVGTQDLGRQTLAFVQGLTDHTLEGARALSGVKSLKEATEIQVTYARGTMERVLSETAKLQEASFRLAEQVAAPVTQRVTMAVERATKPLAV